ncbi:MAG: hypothetical protein IJU70_08440, partial [Lentisphaeria bacterium]|nr:hypothetical protein [Lentisphaeria bacterium]
LLTFFSGRRQAVAAENGCGIFCQAYLRFSLLTFFSGRRKTEAAENGRGIFCQAFFEKKRLLPLFFAYFLFGAKRK